MTRLSVIMPVCNEGEYVEQAIDSILEQTYSDFELYICDDRSNDKTPKILKQYKEADERMNVHANKSNMGITGSLNKLIGIAIKNDDIEYIARHDGDDWSEPERFEKQVAFLDKNPEYGVCGSYYMSYSTITDKKSFVRLPTTDADIRRESYDNNRFCHGSVMMRSDMLKEVKGDSGYYDSNFRVGQDNDLWWRAMMSGWLVRNLPEHLYNFRLSQKSIDRRAEYRQIHRELLRKIYCNLVGIKFKYDKSKYPHWMKV